MYNWQPGRGGATATVATAVMCWSPCRMRCDCTDNDGRTSNTQVRQQAVTKGRRIHAHVITPACSTNQATIPNNPSRDKGPNLRPPWIIMGDKTQLWAMDTNTEHLQGILRNPAKYPLTRDWLGVVSLAQQHIWPHLHTNEQRQGATTIQALSGIRRG